MVKPARSVVERIVGADQRQIIVGVDRLAPEGGAGHAHEVDVGVDQAGQDGAVVERSIRRAPGGRRRQARR